MALCPQRLRTKAVWEEDVRKDKGKAGAALLLAAFQEGFGTLQASVAGAPDMY